eukprot:CAMPEP_0197621698 /NCGR_PEP_ID=MMETSP1338-20131121/2196_1 /TAXON_ID=43686 ORGANISM="Pelagodinium beii, Strain RCC1491" /NCGR_SAMPLE_ID=MMETSP1338 /ASSEMBLY_ACC=CAM_ASM_000754 /LENGTH=236 /DNA_ID=CAMNT_0043191225 /DNA_START=47 /DNA_END=757 /DNA_ORIENTATION=-
MNPKTSVALLSCLLSPQLVQSHGSNSTALRGAKWSQQMANVTSSNESDQGQVGSLLDGHNLNETEALELQAEWGAEGWYGAYWHVGGDKVWGAGKGVEDVNAGNVGYYDKGMSAALAHCGGSACALIVNPPGHRSVDTFHIHFVHYSSYGAHLKDDLEALVCGKGGWHAGGPCGGRAAYFPGFPGVFSVAMGGGSLHHASVIAWPDSCGGRGTIVELAFGCSIEHQIRGDYNPALR